MHGLYIHLPFCTTHCTYCPFAISTDLALQDAYTTALVREISASAAPHPGPLPGGEREKIGPHPPFLRFTLFWAIGSLLLYAWAREKVPWLTVHALLPITILAADGLAWLWSIRRETVARIALAAFSFLALVNASGMYLASFRYGAHDKEREPNHAEILAYVQTTWDLKRALQPVQAARQRLAPNDPVITVAGEA
nr:hypothetical protein [Acidobacteriota bacterium]